ncbi:putative nonstructural protein [Eel River basin pequenovirus]|nr:putative nonstructural protein [Eel River basin pequenovirus]
MKIKIFSVYDKQAGAFLNPFFLNTEGEAVRAISDLVADPEHLFSRHPSDYVLYHHGHIDNEAGSFETFDSPQKIISCLEIAARKDS